MRRLLFALAAVWPLPVFATKSVPTTPAPVAAASAENLYRDMGLDGRLDSTVFEAARTRALGHGIEPGVMAIIDMTKPSTEQRLFIVDFKAKKLELQTWVAHGQNSGELFATRFSNRDASHQTSLGMYRVGSRITSPKHGAALLLEGLDRGINDNARAREIIVHGADYVSEAFIAAHGRLGRSWGCPAVPRSEMARVIQLLADGGLLYIHGG